MPNSKRNMIAVDGPAASGKSTIARGLANRLAYRYVNSGAFYRALAHEFLHAGVSAEDAEAVDRLLGKTRIDCDDDGDRVFVSGADVTDALRSREVTHQASIIAKIPRVREKVNQELRRLARDSDCVMDGRDIGSVVFPDATVKLYLEASLEERARRRLKDFAATGSGASLEEISRDIAERDRQDSTRSVAPLRPSEGAIVYNSTGRSPQEVVDQLLALMEHKLVRRTDAGGREPGARGGMEDTTVNGGE
jgi:cytidylate kinase